MPRFLEDRLRAEAAKQGLKGKQADRYVFGTLNNIGAVNGNKETAKGRAMEAKHQRDTEGPSHPGRNLGQFLHPRKKKG